MKPSEHSFNGEHEIRIYVTIVMNPNTVEISKISSRNVYFFKLHPLLHGPRTEILDKDHDNSKPQESAS